MIIVPLYITVCVLYILYILLLVLLLLWTMLLHDVIYVLLLTEYVYSVTACMILLYAVNSPVIGYLTGKLTFFYLVSSY